MKTQSTPMKSRNWSWRGLAVTIALSASSLVSSAQDNQLDRTAMLNAVNAERTSRGFKALSWNNWLEAAALRQTRDMYNKKFLSHTGSDGSSMSDRVSATGYQWTAVSENVAQGYTTVSEVMTGWMNSTGHRTNILDSGVLEIGAAKVGDYWTQVFAYPTGGTLGRGGSTIAGNTAGRPYHDYAITIRDYYNANNQANLALAWFYYYEGLGFYFDYVEAGQYQTGLAYYYLYGSYYNYYYYATYGYPAFAWYAFYYWYALGYQAYYQGLGDTSSANYYYNLYVYYAESYYSYYRSLGYY